MVIKDGETADIRAEINGLRSLSRKQLLQKWQKVFNGVPAPSIRRELMIPFLA